MPWLLLYFHSESRPASLILDVGAAYDDVGNPSFRSSALEIVRILPTVEYIQYNDTDCGRSRASGTLLFSPGETQDGVREYRLYWGYSNGTKASNTPFQRVNASASVSVYNVTLTKIALVGSATHILIVSSNFDNQESAVTTYSFYDARPPAVPATTDIFIDLHCDKSVTSGPIKIIPSAVLDVHGYEIYWSRNTSSSGIISKLLSVPYNQTVSYQLNPFFTF